MTFTQSASRRTFLRRMSDLGIAGTAAPFAASLAAMGEAAAQSASDYKALVCVFLYGGNDNGNTVIPIDEDGYRNYQQVRSSLALDRSALSATTLPIGVGSHRFALHPGLQPLMPIFNAKRLGIQLNVGPLIQPTTLQQYRDRSVPLPPKLFSHNDQQSVWQSSQAEGSTLGWGGTMGDLAASSTGQNANFTCISASGNAVFLSGQHTIPYRISPNGVIPIRALTDTLCAGFGNCGDVLRELLTEPRAHVLENELNQVAARALNAQGMIQAALADTTASEAPFAALGSNRLANQLKIVAKMIEGHTRLGMKRQVFMVSLGGFDTHDYLLRDHAPLMTQLGAAMAAFDAALQATRMANQVTTFTASDFGRTLTPNRDGGDAGSDHGWGSHHFLMGGAVTGGQFFGTPPTTRLNEGEDVGRGALLPTTSVDTYAAGLARWFGVSERDLALILPNIGNFSQKAAYFR